METRKRLNPKAIVGGRVVLRDRIVERSVIVEGGKILRIGKPKGGEELIELNGEFVLPGLIDLHFHGPFILPSPKDAESVLRRVSKLLLSSGCTGFLATLATAKLEALIGCLRVFQRLKDEDFYGAQFLGVHLEGPFLNPCAKGAQPVECIIEYNPLDREQEELFLSGKGLVKMMTIAPEMPNGEALISRLNRAKILASIGHSNASFEDVKRFNSLGVKHITHLFNAMSGIHHRGPGVALAGLVLEDMSVELIVDGHHIHPEVVKLVEKLSRDRLILITDAVGEEERDIPPMLAPGVFAGTGLRLNRAIKNLIEFCGIELVQAVKYASLYPARVLGLEQRIGSIEMGKEANIVITDSALNVKQVLIKGDIVYPSPDIA